MVVPHRLFFSIFLFIAAVAGCADDDRHDASVALVRPTQILSYEGSGVDLDARNTWVSVAARGHGIHLFDATHADHLVSLANLQLPFVYRTMLSDGLVFGFDEQKGLSTADLAGLDNLSLTNALSSVELRGFVSAAEWSGNRLVTANSATGLQVHEGNPGLQLTRAPSPPALPTTAIDHVSRTKHGLVVADQHGTLGLYSHDQLDLVGWLATSHAIHDLSCFDQRCFALSARDGVFVYDVTADGAFHQIATKTFKHTVDRVVATRDHALISFVGLREQFGVYTLHRTSLAGGKTITTSRRVADMAHNDTYVYVLLDEAELHVYAAGNF